jgi:pentose-5-phosphate-3-epimerase
VLASLRKATPAFLDCHLMVSHPEQWVDEFSKAGADMFTFHLESIVGDISVGSITDASKTEGTNTDVMALISHIRRSHMHVGIALKPSTPVHALLPYCDLIDMVRFPSVMHEQLLTPGAGTRDTRCQYAFSAKKLSIKMFSLADTFVIMLAKRCCGKSVIC